MNLDDLPPRDVCVSTLGPHLTRPESHDLVALRVTVDGVKNGAPQSYTC